jgi:surface protein
MLYGASSFNQPLEKLNVSNVTDMGGMFNGANSFNQPLEKWNVSYVANSAGEDAYWLMGCILEDIFPSRVIVRKLCL